MKKIPLIASIFLIFASYATATTYYIDYQNGDDEADGLSAQTAWKHSPGDKEGAGLPRAAKLAPGDILLFKGGVQYLGEVRLRDVAGSESEPIILDGNTEGNFGTGRAIFDGASMIHNWKPVGNASEVQGNANWQKIMYADLDLDLANNFSHDVFVPHRDAKPDLQAPWQRLFLIDGERRVLPIAQRPKPTDDFYPDLPADYYTSPVKVTDNYPHKVYYEEGSRGNSSLPLIAITYGGNAPVIQPFNGGTVTVEMNQTEPISEIGFTLYRPKTTPVPEQVAFMADGQEIYVAEVDPEQEAMQRFKLPKTIEASKLSFQLRHSSSDKTWTKFQQIAAFKPDGENVIEKEISSVIEDSERITQKDPNWYDDMFVGLHGGNNHVYFSRIKQYDPETHRLHVSHFSSRLYDQTKYALYNSPKFIDVPGEWCLVPLEDGKTRVFFWPEQLKNGQPDNIGYPVLKTAVSLEGATSHIEVRGFLMQRYSGGFGGVNTKGRGKDRPSHIRIADCEIRFISGQSGISLNHSDYIEVENCYVHHCPGWTVGTYVNRINHYKLINNRIDNNSGSGIRHYESTHGELTGNTVLNHYGMHSSGLNFYEGCADILFEGNYIQNVIAINRNAENLTFRNNVVDSQDRNAVSVAMWGSGRTGGRDIKNVTFENNTFINVEHDLNWSTAIFVQSGASAPTGLVARNNILDRLRPPFPGTVEGNIYMRETDASVAGSGSMVVEDPNKLFIDPANGDYRRKPGGPMMEAGANISPPSKQWNP